jgi:hypothetical protein
LRDEIPMLSGKGSSCLPKLTFVVCLFSKKKPLTF